MGGRIWKPIIPVTISCHWSGGSCALSGLGRSPELFLPSRLTPSGPARPSTEPAADRLPHIPQTQPSTRACSPTYNTRLVVAIFFTSVSAGSRRSARPLSVALSLRSASGRRDCRLRPFPPTAASRNPEECGRSGAGGAGGNKPRSDQPRNYRQLWPTANTLPSGMSSHLFLANSEAKNGFHILKGQGGARQYFITDENSMKLKFQYQEVLLGTETIVPVTKERDLFHPKPMIFYYLTPWEFLF